MQQQENTPNLIVILGPTASGKTALGVQLARDLKGEIISADSRQVYRGMDLGTGKDLAEYEEIQHHLIDIRDPGYEYNLYEFQLNFHEAFRKVSAKNKIPILVGGSGLYLDAIVFNYQIQTVPIDETLRKELAALSLEQLQERLRSGQGQLHNTTDLQSRTRLVRAIEIAEFSGTTPVKKKHLQKVNPLIFGLQWEPEQLRKRIAKRLTQRMDQGMIAEARRLHERGLSYEKMEYYGLEYKFLARYLKGELNRNDMTQKLRSAICQFAKRQRSWFRRMERKGAKIHWLTQSATFHSEALKTLREFKILDSTI
ncbi:MAG: tRNA (adenosine(37)-N6)-dimethylallyltransferase MiaA [Acidobacteria bacterium]|nr:MAG: tRNA (adenosine(37)-N6)-dimethylallyltransferase MiaA [Acidobacteriota bacterium]